jgi:hypothetical protein
MCWGFSHVSTIDAVCCAVQFGSCECGCGTEVGHGMGHSYPSFGCIQLWISWRFGKCKGWQSHGDLPSQAQDIIHACMHNIVLVLLFFHRLGLCASDCFGRRCKSKGSSGAHPHKGLLRYCVVHTAAAAMQLAKGVMCMLARPAAFVGSALWPYDPNTQSRMRVIWWASSLWRATVSRQG